MDVPMKHETSDRCRASRSMKQPSSIMISWNLMRAKHNSNRQRSPWENSSPNSKVTLSTIVIGLLNLNKLKDKVKNVLRHYSLILIEPCPRTEIQDATQQFNMTGICVPPMWVAGQEVLWDGTCGKEAYRTSQVPVFGIVVGKIP